MTDTEVLIRYNLDEFFSFKKANEYLPDNLENYCLSNNNSKLSIRKEFYTELSEITESAFNKIDPNDILIKNTIREYLNIISNTNYSLTLEKLKTIKFTNKNHFYILCEELTNRSMNDAIASKGIEITNNENYISEINTEIIKEFCKFYIKVSDDTGEIQTIKFLKVITSYCQKIFLDFLDETKPLDENNKHRIENYKGFMNFMGLLYKKKIIKDKIIFVCMSSVINSIFDGKIKKYECDNLLNGYIRVLNQILLTDDDDNKSFISSIIELSNIIIEKNSKNEKISNINILSLKNNIDKLLEKIEIT